MAQSSDNSRKPWTKEDVDLLKQLAKENTPTRVMGLKLGRSESSVRAKAGSEKISLRPTNQRPNKGKKE